MRHMGEPNAIQTSHLDRRVTRLLQSKRRSTRLALQILGVYVPRQVKIGADLRLPHCAAGLVVHWSTTIGDRVTLFNGVTLGRAEPWVGAMSLDNPSGGIDVEDDVIVGAGAVVLFRAGQTVTLGRGCIIGANAVVTQSVPPGEVWAGNPASRVSHRQTPLSR